MNIPAPKYKIGTVVFIKRNNYFVEDKDILITTITNCCFKGNRWTYNGVFEENIFDFNSNYNPVTNTIEVGE